MSIARKLYWDGIAPSGDHFEHYAEVEAHLKTLTIHDGHVPLRGNGQSGSWDSMLSRPVVCPPLVGGTITAPHFLEFALSFTDDMEEYLGGFPYLYSVHSFWTRPSNDRMNEDIQVWHRDRDADHFLVLFMFGSPVMEIEDGPHQFQTRTHRGVQGGHIEFMYGRAGDCFIADTRGLHMGMRPTRGQRLIHWARWCLGTEPQSYAWDKMAPIAASQVPIARPDERLRESTKLLIDWN